MKQKLRFYFTLCGVLLLSGWSAVMLAQPSCIPGGLTVLLTGTSTGSPIVAAITPSPGTTELSCTVPSITLTASGGTSYLWDNLTVNAVRVVNTPGTYTVTVSDTNGCSDTTSIEITGNFALNATISGTATIPQNAMTTATITFTGSGGTAPYTFTYHVNGGPVQTVSTTSGNIVTVPQSNAVLGTFVYSLLSVQDASGCIRNFSAPLPTATITVVESIASTEFTTSFVIEATNFLTATTRTAIYTIDNIGTVANNTPVTFTITIPFTRFTSTVPTMNGMVNLFGVDIPTNNGDWDITPIVIPLLGTVAYECVLKPGVQIGENESSVIQLSLTALANAGQGTTTGQIQTATGGDQDSNNNLSQATLNINN